MAYKLKIIIGSTRPGRKGLPISSWIFNVAQQLPEFDAELVDLAEVNLPFIDEPHHPRVRQYQHQHTKDWSEKINASDAFIMVTPEYNYGYSAPLKNAIDYLYHEWLYKPVAFVSYGGVSAGTRAIQQLKQVVGSLKMVAVTEAINLPFFTKHIDEHGNFIADEGLMKSANIMLTELAKWSETLKAMRGK